MKKYIILCVLGFIICTAFDTQNTPPTDYRDAYVGAYFCKSICSKSEIQGAGRQTSNTNDTITINVSKDVVDSILQIKLAAGIVKVKLVNKYLKAYNTVYHCGGNFFATDSIDFFFAQGRACSYKYKGKKK